MTNKKQIKTIIKKDQQKPAPVSLGDVQNKIIVLRGEPVILDRDVAKYVKLAMNEVDPVYTQKTLNAGENAMYHLSRELSYCAVRPWNNAWIR